MCLPMLAMATVVAAASPSPLVLNLTARKSDLLVGEPTKVEVAWSSSAVTQVWTKHLQLWLDDGDGARLWREARDSREPITVQDEHPRALTPGSTITTSYLVGATGSMTHGYQLAFPRVGRYALSARYSVDGVSVSSNTIVLRTEHPSGRDAELFERHLRARPELVSAQWWLVLYEGLETPLRQIWQ